MEFLKRILTALMIVTAGSSVNGSVCSRENRTQDLTKCIEKAREVLFEPDTFWFGNSYTQRCPDNENSGVFCLNPKPAAHSIHVRLFPSTEYTAGLDRFLELEFQSSGKNYNACGNQFKTTESWSYDVDPTSDTIVIPWYVKNFPISVKWTYNAGEYYTLMVYDAGYLTSNGLYINIQGDDISSAEVVRPYGQPLIGTAIKNPYLFLLFKQNGTITLSDEWKNKLTTGNQAGAWTIEEFSTAVNMTGLVAINWIVVTGDEWAAQTMMDRGGPYALCPVFATKGTQNIGILYSRIVQAICNSLSGQVADCAHLPLTALASYPARERRIFHVRTLPRWFYPGAQQYPKQHAGVIWRFPTQLKHGKPPYDPQFKFEFESEFETSFQIFYNVNSDNRSIEYFYISKALHEKSRPFIPSDTQLSVWIDFEFMIPADQTIDVCCKKSSYSARNFTLNPLGNELLSTWDVRSETPHIFTFTKLGYYTQRNNFTGDMYAVIALDPDPKVSSAGTEERPILHGLTTNIVDGNYIGGETGLSWTGPFPPDNSPHYYYTLIYKQQANINATELRYNYAGDCSGGLSGRCLFDINLAVSENNLTLVGATWFRSQKDAYVLKRQLEQPGSSEATVCNGQPGYSDPCTTGSTTAVLPSILYMCILVLISFAF